jgi:hypothetical protein
MQSNPMVLPQDKYDRRGLKRFLMSKNKQKGKWTAS